MRALLALVALAACDGHEPLTTCAGDLRGVWRAPGTSASGEARRFQIIAGPYSWELYPMFDDGVVEAPLEDGVLAAPSVIDVQRWGARSAMFGTWTRRYERRNRRCVVTRPAVIAQCHDDSFTLLAAPPPAPAILATCAPGAASSIEWRFVRD